MNGYSGDRCEKGDSERVPDQLKMQNLWRQTKSIMVFSEVAYYEKGRKFMSFLGIVAIARIKIAIPWISKERTCWF